MVRKTVIGILVIFLSAVVGSFLAKEYATAPADLILPSPIMNPEDIVSSKFSLPVNTEEQVLKEINRLRGEKKLKEIKVNDQMTKAARARLAVISSFRDYTGTSSGITREKSLENIAYKAAVVGDIHLIATSEDNDFLSQLIKDPIDEETVLYPQFTEIGVAKLEGDNFAQIYIIFASKQNKPAATTTSLPTSRPKVVWGGPELWTAVNKRRVEFGVGQLSRKDELCTIASIRLNELLELGKLDGHSGFQPVLNRSDLKWISEKYNISEYLAQGYPTPEETVKGWENTLGHRSLLTGGEFVWGCIYSQNSFAVAITAY